MSSLPQTSGRKGFCGAEKPARKGCSQAGGHCPGTSDHPHSLLGSQEPGHVATASQGPPLYLRQPPGQTQLPTAVSQSHTPSQVFVGSPVMGLLCKRGLRRREPESEHQSLVGGGEAFLSPRGSKGQKGGKTCLLGGQGPWGGGGSGQSHLLGEREVREEMRR